MAANMNSCSFLTHNVALQRVQLLAARVKQTFINDDVLRLSSSTS
jgi:hypothetical protein